MDTVFHTELAVDCPSFASMAMEHESSRGEANRDHEKFFLRLNPERSRPHWQTNLKRSNHIHNFVSLFLLSHCLWDLLLLILPSPQHSVHLQPAERMPRRRHRRRQERRGQVSLEQSCPLFAIRPRYDIVPHPTALASIFAGSRC